MGEHTEKIRKEQVENKENILRKSEKIVGSMERTGRDLKGLHTGYYTSNGLYGIS